MKTYNNPTTNVVELDLQQAVMQMYAQSPAVESKTGGNTSGSGSDF